MPPAADEVQWWEKDSVEFWVQDAQYALRFGPWGCNLWTNGGTVEGARGAWRATTGGYQFELAIPLSAAGEAATQGLGGQLRFAFGINDCDATGRKSQLYYPGGWVHSNAATFAQAVLADGEGKAPAARPDLRPALEPSTRPVKPGQADFQCTLKSGKSSLPGFVTLGLLGEGPDLQITVDAADREQTVGRFTVPQPARAGPPGARDRRGLQRRHRRADR